MTQTALLATDGLRKARVAWGGIGGGALSTFVVALLVVPIDSAAPLRASPLAAALCAAYLVALLLSFALPARIPFSGQGASAAMVRFTVGAALAESGTLMGLVAYLATAERWALLLMAAGAVGILLHFPTEARWDRLAAPAREARGGNRMVR